MRALDGASQFRGIGIYILRLCHELIPQLLKDHEVILYVYDQSNLKDVDPKLVKKCRVVQTDRPSATKLPSLVQRLVGAFASREYNRTDNLPEIGTIDSFFQPYHEFGVPKGVHSVVVCHDLIPLVFKEKYFGRINPGISPVTWLAYIRERFQEKTYIESLEVFSRANQVIAVSSHTKKTLTEHLGVASSSIKVILHGNEPAPKQEITERIKRATTEPYVAYIGGVDYRREISGLLKAAPTLYADHGIRIVVAGNDFITTGDAEVRRSLEASEHVNAVTSLGFVSEGEKQALIAHAIAFVYPTYYEGFGLPVLEAFNAKSPIITFKNSSIPEVGGNAALYAKDIDDMLSIAVKLNDDNVYRKDIVSLGTAQAKKFSWKKTASETMDVIVS